MSARERIAERAPDPTHVGVLPTRGGVLRTSPLDQERDRAQQRIGLEPPVAPAPPDRHDLVEQRLRFREVAALHGQDRLVVDHLGHPGEILGRPVGLEAPAQEVVGLREVPEAQGDVAQEGLRSGDAHLGEIRSHRERVPCRAFGRLDVAVLDREPGHVLERGGRAEPTVGAPGRRPRPGRALPRRTGPTPSTAVPRRSRGSTRPPAAHHGSTRGPIEGCRDRAAPLRPARPATRSRSANRHVS